MVGREAWAEASASGGESIEGGPVGGWWYVYSVCEMGGGGGDGKYTLGRGWRGEREDGGGGGGKGWGGGGLHCCSPGFLWERGGSLSWIWRSWDSR